MLGRPVQALVSEQGCCLLFPADRIALVLLKLLKIYFSCIYLGGTDMDQMTTTTAGPLTLWVNLGAQAWQESAFS